MSNEPTEEAEELLTFSSEGEIPVRPVLPAKLFFMVLVTNDSNA